MRSKRRLEPAQTALNRWFLAEKNKKTFHLQLF